MKEFFIKPSIRQYADFSHFLKDIALTKDDLILTNEYIFSPHFNAADLVCDVLYQERYGSGEPSDDMVYAILNDITRNYRRIIAIGGGTILDIAKLLSLKNRNHLADLYMQKELPEKSCTLIAVPTTCGTGSEVTNVSVLALNQLGTKKGLAHPALFPDFVALVPDLLTGLPFHFFATSSLDALIHAFESILSPKADAFSKAYGYRAAEIILQGYKKIAQNGKEARIPLLHDFLIASTMAGISFSNAGCAAIHALSYPLSAKYHVAHGEANYAIFPGVMQKYMELNCTGEIAVLNRFAANILVCDSDYVYAELQTLLNSILIHKPLHTYGVTENDLVKFTESVMTNQERLMKNSFVTLDRNHVYKIYQELL